MLRTVTLTLEFSDFSCDPSDSDSPTKLSSLSLDSDFPSFRDLLRLIELWTLCESRRVVICLARG